MSERKKSGCEVGLRFFGFLRDTDRAAIRARAELKDIYNNEFKAVNQTKVPNFSSVLFGLKMSKKIKVGRDYIYVNSKARGFLVDQWYTPNRPRVQEALNGAAHPSPAPSPDQPAMSADEEKKKCAMLFVEQLKKNRAHYVADKNGIVITSKHQFNDGSLFIELQKTECVVNLTVENSGTETVHFTSYTVLHKLSCFTLSDENKVTRQNPLVLKPGDTYEIQVLYQLKCAGNYPATLAFEFKQDLDSPSFHIVRYIQVHYVTTLGMELKPVAPFKRSLPAQLPVSEYKILMGQPPEGMSKNQLKNATPLKYYRIPGDMPSLIQSLKNDTHSDKRETLECSLTFENYSDKFHLMLYLEEHQMEVDIRRYFIPNSQMKFATMERDRYNKKLLILKIPGLSENRPSVLRGDKLMVYPQEETCVKYCGYVHKVERDSVKLGFHSDLLDKFIDGMKFNVEFTINRLMLRVQHRAVDFATFREVLFPQRSYHLKIPELPTLRFYDIQLERNPEQSKAVRHIVAGTSKPAPYLVFGPPGTGKTVTLVEAIKQIVKTQPHCHILACAPSNSATDLLCEKISEHVDKRCLYRMYACSRDPQCVPVKLKECCNLEGECYIFPPKEDLMKYRVIVTTLITAGRLVTGNLPKGHFTHFFVDEAGHATETECLIPLAGLLDPKSGQVVLAGDHKQLGPIVSSPLAQKFGMGISLLERMMKSVSLYQKKDDVFDNNFVTKLLCNYRSHPAILKIPNELFYDGELQVCANEMKRNYFCNWEHLKKKDIPVIFHGVTGIDEREATSPSFFNRAEVDVLMHYVKKLLQTGGKKGMATISPKDIGIIAPYRKQVEKIRQGLNKIGKDFKHMDMHALKVGSVEEFQGQERRVVLVSAVRSNREYTEFDKKFSLGFITNDKRFNVALTRAQALLIVVGNPFVLHVDPVWKCFINYCRDSGVYEYEHAEEDDDVVARLSALFMKIELQVESDSHQLHLPQVEE
ncbi:putative helicase mov-10-B.1 isoform X2 [Dunckerocampus dactyliophorus]|uniref:putative helicase mov-10-B.1 isoform X2 n=1 Tax=Dunckerocampus dactyliophorus TaxID=161453 RepID=UPI002406EDCE|nr:putative helicase mov-10-B.1 isoform X2 [Dunckerocampus dactyliophorus]